MENESAPSNVYSQGISRPYPPPLLTRLPFTVTFPLFVDRFVYYTVKLQVGTELCLKPVDLLSVDFPIVSLHEVFLYDKPLN